VGLFVLGWVLGVAVASDGGACRAARRSDNRDAWVGYVVSHPAGRCVGEAYGSLVRHGLDPGALGRALSDLSSTDPAVQVAARQWLLGAHPQAAPAAPGAWMAERPTPPARDQLPHHPPDAQVSESGLAWVVLVSGQGGPLPGPSSRVEVHYAGWSTDGTCFDDSWARGLPMQLPVNGVIAGFAEALQGMEAGEVRRVWIPPALAYGEAPRSGAPAGLLVFDLALLRILEP
jgi:peptidylprolyl isomerase